MLPKVSIIILNWNQPEFTVNCVKSVLKQDYQDFEILIVDNGSKDNSVEIFKKKFSGNKKIRILETGKNLGYAGGNNFGVKRAKGEYVVILNNDTLVEKDWLVELVKSLESDDKIGAVSATEIRNNFDEENKIDLKTKGDTQTLLGYPAYYALKKPLERTELVDVFGIDGCSFIYKKDLANPPFDSEYFIYAEDAYLNWLLKLKGYRNKLSTTAIVHHFHNTVRKGDKKINCYFIYLGERNRVLNVLLFYEMKNLVKILPLLLINIILLNLFELKKVPYRLKSYFWLLTHLGKIREKRGHVQEQRRVPDEKIISEMSCKMMEESKVEQREFQKILRAVNKIFQLYCRLVKVRTVESIDFYSL